MKMEGDTGTAPNTEYLYSPDKGDMVQQVVFGTRANRLPALRAVSSLNPASISEELGAKVLLEGKEAGEDGAVEKNRGKIVATYDGDPAMENSDGHQLTSSDLQRVLASEDVKGKPSYKKGTGDKNECREETGIETRKPDENEAAKNIENSELPIAPDLETVSASEMIKEEALDLKEHQCDNKGLCHDAFERTKLEKIDVESDTLDSQPPTIPNPESASTPDKSDAKPLSTRDAVSKRTDILNLTDTNEDLAVEEDQSTIVGIGVGLGGFSRRPIKNKYRKFNSSRLSRHRKPRIPSWTAPAETPEAKIDESVVQILKFIKGASNQKDDDPGIDNERQFKAFLDANKEIVRWWLIFESGRYGGHPKTMMAENVDCIHAILVAWSDDTDKCGSWVNQAMELTELCLAFARGWETLTGREVGVPEWFNLDNGINKPLRGDATAEVDENMEYIHPSSIDMNTNNNLIKGGRHTGTSSTISRSQRTPSPRKPNLGQTPPTQQKTPSERADSSTANSNSYAPSATQEEITDLHKRLSRIEDLLISQQTFEKALTRVVEMQQLMLQDISDGIYGDGTQSIIYDSEDRKLAKTTGLLMMNKSLANNEEVKISALEEENNKLRVELEKLKAAFQVEGSHANVEREVQELKRVIGGFCALLSKEPDAKEDKTWTDEAWDDAMEMYWPQGDPAQTPNSDSGLDFEDMPVVNQAGRGQGGGSGIGGCAVM